MNEQLYGAWLLAGVTVIKMSAHLSSKKIEYVSFLYMSVMLRNLQVGEYIHCQVL